MVKSKRKRIRMTGTMKRQQLLRCTEGVARSVMSIMKQELMASPITKLGALISKSGFKRVKKRMDYTEYGVETSPRSLAFGTRSARCHFAQ